MDSAAMVRLLLAPLYWMAGCLFWIVVAGIVAGLFLS